MEPNQLSELPFETRLAMFESAARSAGYRSRDVTSLTNLIQLQHQRQLQSELVREGITDLEDLAQVDPRGALNLAKEGFKPGQKKSAEERKKIAQEQKLVDNIALLEKNYKQIKGRGPVLGPFLIGAQAGTGGFLAAQTRDYEALRQGLIGPVARVVSGEVGQLTNQDIRRAKKMLPMVTDTPRVAEMKLNNLKATLSLSEDIGQQTGDDPLNLGL